MPVSLVGSNGFLLCDTYDPALNEYRVEPVSFSAYEANHNILIHKSLFSSVILPSILSDPYQTNIYLLCYRKNNGLINKLNHPYVSDEVGGVFGVRV